MRTTILCFIVFFSFIYSTHAQICSGNYIINSQQALDEFGLNNQDCIQIDGNLYIGSSEFGVSDFSFFENIQSVSGTLEIWLGDLGGNNTLNAFNNLAQVGSLLITDYDGSQQTTNVGFNNLNSVSDSLILVGLMPQGFNNLQLVSGDLQVYGNFAASANDWSGCFPALMQINGDLRLEEIVCNDFSSFNSLISVQGNLSMDLMQINNFSSFTNLQSVQGTLSIAQGDAVTINNFNSFTELEHVEGDVVLGLLGFLTVNNTWSSFESLSTIGNRLDMMVISTNEMTNFPLLSDVDMVSLYLDGPNFPDFPAVVSLNMLSVTTNADEVSFSALQWVDDLNISGLLPSSITSIEFPVLSTVLTNLTVASTNTTELPFLQTLNYIGVSVLIHNNPLLTICLSPAICELAIENSDDISFDQNGGAICNSLVNFLESCEAYTIVSGSVFSDTNCDGLYTPEEPIIPNQWVFDEENNPMIMATNSQGFNLLLSDNQIVNLHVNDYPGYENSTTYSLNEAVIDPQLTLNFAMCPVQTGSSYSIHIVADNEPRPGFDHSILLYYQSHYGINDEFEIVYDYQIYEGTQLVSASPGYVQNGTVLTWSFTGMQAFESGWISIIINIPASATLGTEAVSTAYLNCSTDFDVSDNSYEEVFTLIGSYDPNDISVSPELINIEEVNSSGDWRLTYLIRFQNTGTASAINVRVEDNMELGLDLSTLQMIGASHSYEVDMTENRNLIWYFNEINLPDSNANEEESHGFIMFEISAHSPYFVGQTVANGVGIYFDFNEPIFTNVAHSLIYDCPLPPTITQTGNVLSADGSGPYEWLFNGVLLPSSENSIEIFESGTYSVAASNQYCSSDFTSGNFVYTAIADVADAMAWNVSPIPAKGFIVLTTNSPQEGNVGVRLFDGLGKWLFSQPVYSTNTRMDISNLPAGVYLVNWNNEFKKVMIE